MNKKLVLLLFAASLMFGPNGSGAEKNPKQAAKRANEAT
jgi:hypothetical protein